MALLVPFVVNGNHPHTIVEEPGFRDFTSSLRPEFKPICANTLKAKILQNYRVKQEELKVYFRTAKIGRLSFSTDMWTAPNRHAMMSLTVSWLDEEFKLFDLILGFHEFQGPHTGENICDTFRKICEFYGIENQVHINSNETIAGIAYVVSFYHILSDFLRHNR